MTSLFNSPKWGFWNPDTLSGSGPTVISSNERSKWVKGSCQGLPNEMKSNRGQLTRPQLEMEMEMWPWIPYRTYVRIGPSQRQDSDYECAARDFQLSPNYVSNSYEIAGDFWEDGLGNGIGYGEWELLRACHVRRTAMTQFPKDLQPKRTKVARCPSLQDVLYAVLYAIRYICYMLSGVAAPPIRSQLKISETNCGSRLPSLTRCPQQILQREKLIG